MSEAQANFVSLQRVINSRTLYSRIKTYLKQAILSSARKSTTNPHSSGGTEFISLGVSLSLTKVISLVISEPVRLRTWEAKPLKEPSSRCSEVRLGVLRRALEGTKKAMRFLNFKGRGIKGDEPIVRLRGTSFPN